MADTLISIVLPSYNRCQWLGEALDSLVVLRTDDKFAYEIVVVDNASTDATREVVHERAASSAVPIRYFSQSDPGDAPTRNRGVSEARGAWLAFFDDDQFAEPDWLLELYQAAMATDAGVVGGPVALALPPQQLVKLGPVCRGALREVAFYDELHPYEGKALPGTGNALVSRTVFDTVGMFDVSMSGGGSDSDLFLRARAAGFTLWYTPQAVIRHRIPASRLTAEYFRWDAWCCGASHLAHFDHQRRGRVALAALCAARLGQALAVHLPRWLWARMRGDEMAALGWRSRLWRTEGYVRKTLAILAPRWCAQRQFFEALEFRQGRSIGAPIAAMPAASTPHNARNDYETVASL